MDRRATFLFRDQPYDPYIEAMDSHGGSVYDRVQDEAKARRDAILARIGAA